MQVRRNARLAELTTLGVGGPIDRLVEVSDAAELVAAVREADDAGRPLLVLGGGSNLIGPDDGWPGDVVAVRSRGVERDGGRLLVQAGEPWDHLVAHTVEQQLAGMEAMSGIPGSTGATPVQNVGAYGQEVAETLAAVRVYDRVRDEVVVLPPEACGFGYRTSVFKHNDRFLVLAVDFRLAAAPLSAPIRYAELARTLDVPVAGRAPLAQVRAAVLGLRAGKGMVLDAGDPDTSSVGSFFTNPVLDGPAFAALRQRAASLGEPPAWPGADGQVKVSAAWLIERAGYGKGYGAPGTGVAISGKHTLALTNRGAGTTRALLDLARDVRAGVHGQFGVLLEPEPVLVGCEL